MGPSVRTAQILTAYMLICYLILDNTVNVGLKDNFWESLQAPWSLSHLDLLQLYT